MREGREGPAIPSHGGRKKGLDGVREKEGGAGIGGEGGKSLRTIERRKGGAVRDHQRGNQNGSTQPKKKKKKKTKNKKRERNRQKRKRGERRPNQGKRRSARPL